MKDSTRTALILGGAGAFCGGCVSLLYLGLTAAAGALGLLFWGLVGLVPAAGLAVAVLYVRHRNLRAGGAAGSAEADAEACEVEPAKAGEGS